jgi:hypothetical protein
MIKNKKDLKEFFQEKLHIYQRQLSTLTSNPDCQYLAKDSIINIKGKIELIQEISTELDMGDIRRKPLIREMII